MAQVVPAFADSAQWIRQNLWVETDFDSDGDGRKDRVHVAVTRPRQTETEGLRVPVVYQSSPYFGGTSALDAYWNVNHEVGAQPPSTAQRHPPPVAVPGHRAGRVSHVPDAAGVMQHTLKNPNAPSALTYAWIGPFVGALVRPIGGWIADKVGGSIVTQVISAVMVVASLFVIGQRHPMYSVLSLILSFGALSGLYVVLDAPFVAVTQIIIYAGAIMVLFLFVVMLLNAHREDDTLPKASIVPRSIIATA